MMAPNWNSTGNLEEQGILEPLKIRMDAQALKEEQKRLEKRQALSFAQPAGNKSNESQGRREKPAGLRILHHCSVYQEIEDGSAYGRQGHSDLSYRTRRRTRNSCFKKIDVGACLA